MFRNKEIRQFAVCFFLIAGVSVILGFAIDRAAGILSFLSSAMFGMAFLIFTKRRYQCIAEISEQIDLVLHNAEYLFIHESEEGELSILRSEIIKMTQRLREMNTALKKEKEDLADSLADIAHQLRTPLTSVNLILSLLENTVDEKERRKLVQEAEELLVQMDWLLTSLLKLSRLDAGIVEFQKQQVNVTGLITAAVRPLLIPMELHDITLRQNISEKTTVLGDFQWLSEAIQNILKNCMESAGDHGWIEIVCEDTVLYTDIKIHDSGAGFEEKELYHMFQRFYRGKNTNTAGYGIGLALCKKIITGQEGTISAENHPDGGAVFIIRFQK